MLERAARLAPLLAMLLCLPALALGLQLDDFGHKMVLEGHGPAGLTAHPLWDLFAFVRPGEQADALRQVGILPWWADPELRMVLVRPVSVLTHLLDEALWPASTALAHLHSLLWMGLAVALVGRLYRQIEGSGPIAALATLLFAVEDAHAWPAAWLANRNGLVALCLGMGALLLHLRWRRAGDRGAGVGAVLLFTLALWAGESALATAGWLFAAQVCLDGRKLAPLLPYAAVVLAWRAAWASLGGGAAGSGLYIDPGDLIRWLPALPERLTWLMAAQWLQVPADLWIVMPDGAVAIGVAALLALGLGLVGWHLLPALKTSPTARFWALAMALSALPPTGAMPMDRLLTFTSVGAMGLLAVASAGGVQLRPLLWLHGPIAALLLLAKVLSVGQMAAVFGADVQVAPPGVATADKRVFFANGTEFTTAYVGIRRRLQGLDEPREMALLAPHLRATSFTRLDDRRLHVVIDGGWLATRPERLLRGARPFAVGERVERPGYAVVIDAINEAARPMAVTITFTEPLEDPHHIWLAWTCEGLGPWTPPAIGEVAKLPAYGLLGCGS